jgi:hypothetical protein
VFGISGFCDGVRWRVGVLLVLMVVFVCCCVCAPVVFAVGDVSSGGAVCVNEGLSGFSVSLPDCRAFERVSPGYDGGETPSGLKLEEPLVSPDGDHLLSFDFAGFAGAENVEENLEDYLGVYVFSRTGLGWVAEAVDPPASRFPRSKLALNAGTASASAELNRTLWEVDLPEEEYPGKRVEEPFHRNAARLAVREAGGYFKVLGPGVFEPEYDRNGENYNVVGASAELGHILVRVEAGPHRSWPGDGTVEGDESLYEYTEVEGGEPVLVGVSNEGRLDGSPSVNDGARLVSECGTKADGISEDGLIVYFAAEHQDGCSGSQPVVSELYARVGAVRTLDLSEPPLQGEGRIEGRDCTGACASEEETSRKPATFQGAADEGKEVFFTSEQALDDAATPGVPNLYEETIEGEGLSARVGSLRWLAANVSGVAAIARDGTRVYFESSSELTKGPNGNGEVAAVGVSNLYVVEPPGAPEATPKLGFVAREPSQSFEVSSGKRTQAGFDTTATGEFLVFESARDLEGTEDSSVTRQLFEYEALGGRVVRVSAGVRSPGGYECEATGRVEGGYDCDGNVNSEEEAPAMVESPNSSLAENGTVVFSSRVALTPQATPGYDVGETQGGQQQYTENVYEYRAGGLYVISSADEAVPSNFYAYPVSRLFGIDATGRDIFFATTDQLLGGESNSQTGWYDAREDGGFPPSIIPSSCIASACQGSVPVAPVLPVPGGSTIGVAGQNATPAPVLSLKPKTRTAGCRKGYVRNSKGKCVQRKHKKKTKRVSHNKGTGRDGRARG